MGALMSSSDAFAGRGRSGGSGHFAGRPSHSPGHHAFRARVHTRVFVGAPLFWPWYYDPFWPPAFWTPVPQPQIYIEQIPESPARESGYWYYCPDSGAYYPYVSECPGGWQRVPPQPPS